MIVKNNTDSKIEVHKLKLGLTGDVYIVGNFIENLASHKQLVQASIAENIEDAEQERIKYEHELKLAREALALESELEEEHNEQGTV